MKPSAIYSKTGKGVQEASGKTSLLKRADRAVLSAIDGRATLGEVAEKVGKGFDGAFELLIAQLDKDGFVREVTAGATSSASQSRPAVPAKAAAKPGASKGSSGGGADDLDFTTIMPALKPAGRPASAASSTPASRSGSSSGQESALYKARQEAEAKAQAERDRVRQEAEAKARAEAEVKARADAEKRLREEAAAKAKAEVEAHVRAAREKAEAEQRAKLEAERRIREDAERKAREEAERALREAEALRQRLEEERRARDEVERKRREEEERRRKEEEARRAREEAERKAREEAERRIREEAERKRREEEERKRREEEERRIEEEARRLREEIEAKAREAAERARREEEDRLLREKEEQVRRAKEAEEARMRQARELEEARGRARQREREGSEGKRGHGETRSRQPTLPAAPSAQEGFPSGESLDALMADLDSFSQREEEERQAREASDRKAREEGTRKAHEDAERRLREQAAAQEERERQRAAEEARRREEEERRAVEERRALEEAERRLREEEQRRQEADERERKAREAAARAQAAAAAAAAAAAPAAPAEDIGVTDNDLDMSEVRRDEAAVAREARKAQRDREREQRKRSKEAEERARAAEREPARYAKARRSVKWGRPVAILFFVALVVAIGALHVVPLPMDQYERMASEALGRPVKIGVGRLSLITGVRFDLENVVVDGSVKIASLRAYPELASLMDEKRKAFRRIELKGVGVPQAALGEVVNARLRGTSLKLGRIVATDVKLMGPVPLPTLEADALMSPDGTVASVTLSGPEGLNARLTPGPKGEVEFDVTAASITVPFAPEISLDSFAMKGSANRQGMNIASWGGAVLDGVVSGAAYLRWSGQWQLEGSMTARNINAAYLAPALLSEGKAEGVGRFSMNGADPAKLHRAARIEGSFAVGKGSLGTFDLSRVLQTSGKQYGGRTKFNELTGHGVYDRGAVALRNVNISAGALSAVASADVAPSGALVGQVVADIRTTAQPLRATLTLGGTVKEPQVRN